jgi:nitronate monooxygenase
VTRIDWDAHPVVLAPMAGGPSTPALAAAASGAGAFVFLAGAYLSPERLREDITDLRAATSDPFGVNLFAPSPDLPALVGEAQVYADLLGPWAADAGVELGQPRWDDDHFGAKVDLLVEVAPAVVSFAFAWPPAEVVDRLQDAGVEVWVTVNEAAEVQWEQELGVDGLVAQGWEAGGHRGGPVDTGLEQPALAELLAAVTAATDLPVIGTGGVMSGADVADVLASGAVAAALGTAFLRGPEAGTAAVHRHALSHRTGTTVTRAFTGRSARALTTTWVELFSEAAPAAYPHVHHVTAPLRAHGKATGEAELVHLWAGTEHARSRELPAAELVRTVLDELAHAKRR